MMVRGDIVWWFGLVLAAAVTVGGAMLSEWSWDNGHVQQAYINAVLATFGVVMAVLFLRMKVRAGESDD